MKDGEFNKAPDIVYPETLDKYIVTGFAFGEKKTSVRRGCISSVGSTGHGFFYGDSGGLPGFSGGGVFYAQNGALMGIVRESESNGRDTQRYADVLEMISVQCDEERSRRYTAYRKKHECWAHQFKFPTLKEGVAILVKLKSLDKGFPQNQAKRRRLSVEDHRMFNRPAGPIQDRISGYCLCIKYGDLSISAVILSKTYAITTLNSIPKPARVLGSPVSVFDAHGRTIEMKIHGICEPSDFVVLKKTDGEFLECPAIVSPGPTDRYLISDFAFGEKKRSVQRGRISSMSSTGHGFFYGDSGGLPGFSGGGVFYAQNGALMGIVRESESNGRDTQRYADVLEMISVQVVLMLIRSFHDEPFSV